MWLSKPWHYSKTDTCAWLRAPPVSRPDVFKVRTPRRHLPVKQTSQRQNTTPEQPSRRFWPQTQRTPQQKANQTSSHQSRTPSPRQQCQPAFCPTAVPTGSWNEVKPKLARTPEQRIVVRTERRAELSEELRNAAYKEQFALPQTNDQRSSCRDINAIFGLFSDVRQPEDTPLGVRVTRGY